MSGAEGHANSAVTCQYRCRPVLHKTAFIHLHVQAEEWIVSQKAVAAGRSHQVACEGHVAVWVLGLQQRGWPMHHLIHVAAHTVQRQIICHLHMDNTVLTQIFHTAVCICQGRHSWWWNQTCEIALEELTSNLKLNCFWKEPRLSKQSQQIPSAGTDFAGDNWRTAAILMPWIKHRGRDRHAGDSWRTVAVLMPWIRHRGRDRHEQIGMRDMPVRHP